MACGEAGGGRRGDGAEETWAASAKCDGSPKFWIK